MTKYIFFGCKEEEEFLYQHCDKLTNEKLIELEERVAEEERREAEKEKEEEDEPERKFTTKDYQKVYLY